MSKQRTRSNSDSGSELEDFDMTDERLFRLSVASIVVFLTVFFAYLEWHRGTLNVSEEDVTGKEVSFPLTKLQRAHLNYVERMQRENILYDRLKYDAIDLRMSQLVDYSFWEFEHGLYERTELRQGFKRYDLLEKVYHPLSSYLTSCKHPSVKCHIITPEHFCHYVNNMTYNSRAKVTPSCYLIVKPPEPPTLPTSSSSTPPSGEKFRRERCEYLDSQQKLLEMILNEANDTCNKYLSSKFTHSQVEQGAMCIDIPFSLDSYYLPDLDRIPCTDGRGNNTLFQVELVDYSVTPLSFLSPPEANHHLSHRLCLV